MDISVIIVSWNARNFLEQCLASVLAAPTKRSLEITVVDNASSDGSPELVESCFPAVKLIRNPRNLGFACANNIGIRASTGRYVSLINSDIKLLGNCLDHLADYLDAHSNVGNAGPRVLNSDLTRQSSCRDFPSLWNNFCQATGLHRLFPRTRFFSGEQIASFPDDHPLPVDVLSGCFWMLRREVLDVVGLLDENFFMYSEDVDWCRRCWDLGWQVVFLPQAEAIHYGAASSGNAPARFAVEQQRAILQYWAKHHGLAARMGIRAILLSRHLLRYAFGLLSQAIRPAATQSRDRMRLSSACMKALVGSDGRTVSEC